jgi:Type II secretory pathway, component PulM
MTLLNRLEPRERLLVIGGGAVLLALAGWLYLWQPLMQQRAAQQDRIARYLAVLDITDRAAPAAGTRTPTCLDPMALGPRVTQSAESAGLSLTRLDPEGARLRITVSQAAYVDVMRWIAALEAGACVRATSVEMSRLTQPGQVSLRMTLEDAR